MIVKHTTKTLDMEEISGLFAEGALQHLTARQRKNLFNEKRGMDGERKVAHILDRFFHKSADHALIHDLRIPDGIGSFAQFDHVILSRLSRTATIIEVKNYGGTLSKNDHGEWVVWYKTRKRPQDIASPTKQAQRQVAVLKAWLKSHNHDLAFTKVGSFVVVPPECSIDRSKVMTEDFVLKADNLIEKWIEFGGISPIGRLFSPGVSSGTLRAIGTQLSAAHNPSTSSLHERVRAAASSLEANDDDPDDVERIEDESRPFAESVPKSVASVTAIKTEPDPESGQSQGPERSSTPAEIAPGIYEHELADGRIAFFSTKSDEIAKARLEEVCLGRAQWNRRSQRWMCDDDRALEIKQVFTESKMSYVSVSPLIAVSVKSETLPPTNPNCEFAGTSNLQVSKVSRKAGGLIEITPGISKRALPDGRVAFLAAKDDAAAIERVRKACKGRGQWKPLFGNWVCEPDDAVVVEELITERRERAL